MTNVPGWIFLLKVIFIQYLENRTGEFMASVVKNFTLTNEQQGRVDQVLRLLLGVSHARMKGMISHGCVKLNGEKCAEGSTLVKGGDTAEIKYDPDHQYRELKKKQWDDRTFTIVYEDSVLLVVNKVANILTVPTDEGSETTLEERVSHYLRHTSKYRNAILVQRLDRGVSGLLVIAKTQEAASGLREQFKEHKPGRIYMAIVKGHPAKDEGTFRSYLKTGDNLDQYSTRDSRDGKLAITHYEVEKFLRDTSLVKVMLETGRRNQIRVQFADKGNPILGDDRYKKKEARHPLWKASRLALHAQTLEFTHPVNGKLMSFTSELPKVMLRFVEQNS